MTGLYGIEAREDPNLKVSAYYVRLNALNELLSPLTRDALQRVWEFTASREMKELRRSAAVGAIASDLIRALNIKEISLGGIEPGCWFVHSGVTHFARQGYDRKLATIHLGSDRRITGVVRRECEITGTADVNMDAEDEISLVLGRLLTVSKFDLVLAGYRKHSWLGSSPVPRSIVLGETLGNVIDLADHGERLKSLELTLRYEQIDDWQSLAFAVHDTFGRFRRAVEHEGAWAHLYDGDRKPANESRHQGLFRLFSRISFEALGIRISPGANYGTGPTDLSLTLQEDIHIVEFKKDYSLQRLIRGLTVQLPIYLRSADAKMGTYAVMCHDRNPQEIQDILEPLRAAAEAEAGILLELEIVDCRPKDPASKAKLPTWL
jgi:hypothetical protein